MTKKIIVFAINTSNKPFTGMTRTDFHYITEIIVGENNEKIKWLADFDDDWIDEPEDFIWDDEPCGSGLSNEEAEEFLKKGKVMGFIDEDRKFNLTGNIKVERSWGGIPGAMFVTNTKIIGKK